MPRAARRKSETNLYHVMLRGNGQRQIFQDEQDNRKFIAALNALKPISGFQVYAYCLMGNHAHLLMRVGEDGESLGQIFKRFGAKYVYWYNAKYMRGGHLFQDRYKSQVIEGDQHLLAALRYIHSNPVKAGIAENARDYPYSSYREYFNPTANQLTDVDFVYQMIDRKALAALHEKDDGEKFIDIKPISAKLSDEQAKKLIYEASGCLTVDEFLALEKEEQAKVLKGLREKNVSYRQLNRLTGVSVGMIQKTINT